jgi:exoribonuclease II
LGAACIVKIDDISQIALLVEDDERLVRVRTPDGRDLRIGRARVQFIDASAVDEDALVDLTRRVAAMAQELSLFELWQVAVGEDDPLDAGDACELLTGARVGAERLAFELSLLSDAIYFDTRGGDLRPRKRKAVEQELLRQDRLAEKERSFEDAVRYVRERLDGAPAGELGEAPDLLDKVRALAVDETQAEASKPVRRLLDRVGYGMGSPWATSARAAFELFVALGEFSPDEDLMLLRTQTRRFFPDWMVDLARGLPEAGGDVRTERLDLEAYTIDDWTTRDYDDALALEPDGQGWRLHVLIADPASLIDPQSPLWAESRLRGTTIYHPTGKIPMLPSVLSEGHLSLVAGRPRPVMDFVLHLDEGYAPWGMTVERLRIQVRENLAYDQVNQMLEAGEGAPDTVAVMRRLHGIARRMQRARLDNGALILRRPEVNVRVTREGEIELQPVSAASPARELVAEMMIAAGDHTAAFLRDNDIPAVFRKQARISDPSTPTLSGVVDDLSSVYAALRQIRRAELCLSPEPHDGLGLAQYVQVTSPLRRFQDLQTHEQIRSFLVTGRPHFTRDEMLQTFAEIEDLSARNQRIQNEARRYWILRYLETHAPSPIRCTAIWRERQAWKVFLDDFGVEGVAHLPGDTDAGARLELDLEFCDPRGGMLRLVGP